MKKMMIAALVAMCIAPAAFAQSAHTAHLQEAETVNTAIKNINAYSAQQQEKAKAQEQADKKTYVLPLQLLIKKAISDLNAEGKAFSFSDVYNKVSALMDESVRTADKNKSPKVEDNHSFGMRASESYAIRFFLETDKHRKTIENKKAQYAELLSAFGKIGSQLSARAITFNPDNSSHMNLIVMQIDATRHKVQAEKTEKRQKWIQQALTDFAKATANNPL